MRTGLSAFKTEGARKGASSFLRRMENLDGDRVLNHDLDRRDLIGRNLLPLSIEHHERLAPAQAIQHVFAHELRHLGLIEAFR